MITKILEYRQWIIWTIAVVLIIMFIHQFFSFLSVEDKLLIQYKENIKSSQKTLLELEFKRGKIEEFKIYNENKLNDLINWKVNETNCQNIFKENINPLWFLFEKTYADEWDEKHILDIKIEKFCKLHELSSEIYFEEDMWTRCSLILQAIYRFETWNLKSYVWNNIFNFRSPWIKKAWKDNYWVNEIRWWFLVFPDKTNSIKFAVDRFYRIDRYKTISQVIWWWCYVSPVDNKKKCFSWYTFTEWHHNNYISFVKEYYKNKMIYLEKIIIQNL